MKSVVSLLLAILLAAPAFAADEAAKAIVPTEKTELFNGKDLSGWVPFHKGKNVDPTTIWAVKEGNIWCLGKPNGYLRTEKEYANYQLTVELRFIKAGNTGVLVHITGPENVWPNCVECQGMHNRMGDMYFWSGMKCKELVKPPGIKMLVPSAEKPVGEWNTYKVLCSGDAVTIIVNGTQMNKVTGCTSSAGKIGLQCEGAEMEVRKVTIEPLPAEAK